MGQSNKFPVVYSIFTQPANADPHAVFIIHVFCYLWAVVFLQILDELPWRAWKVQLLGHALKTSQLLNQLFLGRLLSEFYKCCRSMAVQHRDTDTLAGNHRAFCRDNYAVLNFSPNP